MGSEPASGSGDSTWNRSRVLTIVMSCSQTLVIRAGVGFLYPAYKSLHAIMSDDREAGLAWMRYWGGLAVFSMLETLVDPVLDFLPGYLLTKCVFLIWCMAPSNKSGSNLVFTQIIFPLFKKHHEEIDQQARIVHDSFMEKFGKLIYGNGKMKKW